VQGALLTIDDVKNQLKVGRTTIYKLVNEKKLPVVRITSKPLFRQSDIDALIAMSMN
jgi:excisionase family DNA binding protein